MITNYARVIDNITDIMIEKVIKDKLKTLVIGVSGGADSALCVALMNIAKEKMRLHNGFSDRIPKIIGRSMPIVSNKIEEISRANAIGEFCDDFQEMNLEMGYKNFVGFHIPELMVANDIDEKIRQGNIKARLRMIYLYDTARKNNGLVMSTDNLTEYYCGFWTINGDVGDFSPIQFLWKTEVYDMMRFIADNQGRYNISGIADALYSCVNATPTDGLGITNSDLDQLGVQTYEEADQIFIRYFGGELELEDHVLIQRYNATHFKRNHPNVITREQLLK